MEGGGPGGLGRNTWIKQLREEDGDIPDDAHSSSEPLPTRDINLGGKATLFMGKGDRLLIETPGGGAWGATEGDLDDASAPHVPVWEARGSLAERAAAQASF